MHVFEPIREVLAAMVSPGGSGWLPRLWESGGAPWISLMACGVAAAWSAGGAQAGELAPGDPAPDFSLVGSDGKTYRLADFRGKQAVVVAWFPKAFTGGCTAECKSFRADGAAMRKYKVAYFTASCDEADTNRRFAESLELDYPILSDPDCAVAAAYGVLKPGGKTAQRWTFYIGQDGKILAIDKQVKTASHGQDVGARLKELGVPER